MTQVRISPEGEVLITFGPEEQMSIVALPDEQDVELIDEDFDDDDDDELPALSDDTTVDEIPPVG